jgi:hypothetical protein
VVNPSVFLAKGHFDDEKESLLVAAGFMHGGFRLGS